MLKRLYHKTPDYLKTVLGLCFYLLINVLAASLFSQSFLALKIALTAVVLGWIWSFILKLKYKFIKGASETEVIRLKHVNDIYRSWTSISFGILALLASIGLPFVVSVESQVTVALGVIGIFLLADGLLPIPGASIRIKNDGISSNCLKNNLLLCDIAEIRISENSVAISSVQGMDFINGLELNSTDQERLRKYLLERTGFSANRVLVV